MTSIAVVTPSRGLVHSRTIEAVMSNIAEATAAGHLVTGWYLTHDLPIPDCAERAAELGLASGADVIWFVEEDVIPLDHALLAMLPFVGYPPARGLCDAIAVDYPVGATEDGWGCIVKSDAGEVLWCGLGCTLFRREVFERLPRPWFRDDIQFVRRNDHWEARPTPHAPQHRYGQHDIALSFALREAGMRIEQVPGMTASHAHLEALGAQGTNLGCHQISIRTEIRRQYPGVPA